MSRVDTDSAVEAVAGLRIRPAAAVDDPMLADITARAYLDGGHLDGPDNEYLASLRDVQLRREGAVLLVAELDGTVVGSITVSLPGSALAEYGKPDEAEIRMLAVDPAAAGRGIGSALLAAALDRVATEGMRRVVLHTLDSMTTAHRLYGRFGFVAEPGLDDEIRPGLWLRAYGLTTT